MNKKTLFILIIISFISLFINLYRKENTPSCFTSDEASFGYNAFSILKTGKDEYGSLLPMRLKSFGDYKMPLYSYLSIPFIAIGGLNESSTRALNSTISIFFPLLLFGVSYQLFKNSKISLITALFFALSPGIQTIGKQAHESYLTTFFIFLSFFLLLTYKDKKKNSYGIIFLISLIPLSFGYQFSRLWLFFIGLIAVWFTLKKYISKQFMFVLISTIIILFIPDFIIHPARVGNLLFFNNIGLGLQTAELRSEGGSRLVYNKVTVGLKNFLFSHLVYFSPQFLVIHGDDNKKFGYEGISPITIVEYVFLFIGLYYLFKDKQKYRFIIFIFLLFAPLAGSLSWAGNSITRTLPLIAVINITAAYGFIHLAQELTKFSFGKMIMIIIVLTYGVFGFYSWDFFFNHYPTRAQTIRALQCGNQEMVSYVKNHYQNTDTFYISKKNGQPYIFLLFYLSYPPNKYQKQAQLSNPDEFGFGQVEKFDKFNFNFTYNPLSLKDISIGYPEDFNHIKLSQDKLEKILVKPEEIFWIYKN